MVIGTLPPSFYCVGSNNSCRVRITARIISSKSDYSCANGDGISQAVIGWDGEGDDIEDAFCGVFLSADNWQKAQGIRIKAMMDGLYDLDVVRTLVLYQEIVYGSVVVQVTEITRIEVSFGCS